MYQTGLSKVRIYFAPSNICVANFICFRALIFKRWALHFWSLTHEEKHTLHRVWTAKTLMKVVLKVQRHFKKTSCLFPGLVGSTTGVLLAPQNLCIQMLKNYKGAQNMLSWKGPGRKKVSWGVKKCLNDFSNVLRNSFSVSLFLNNLFNEPLSLTGETLPINKSGKNPLHQVNK